jgi:dihydrofolate reductase
VAQLTYLAITSLDGYIEDAHGRFDWAEPSEEVHAFVNELVRAVGTYLYGRRMYETMMVWETDPSLASGPPVEADFAAIWQRADKVVYSSTLSAPTTTRTHIERSFDPDVVREVKVAADRALMIGGAELAAEAFRAGLVDELQLVLSPVSVGGGKPALPSGLRLDLELLEHRRFEDGTVFLRYRSVAEPRVSRYGVRLPIV